MQKKNIGFLCVNYDAPLCNSETIQSLLACNVTTHVHVWDNCPLKSNSEYFRNSFTSDSCQYHTKFDNSPLSFVYNHLFGIISSVVDYIMILDNDSRFDPSFTMEVNQRILENPEIDLFIPRVFNKLRTISPSIDLYGLLLPYRNQLQVQNSYIFAINSGLVVSARYLRCSGFVYDERLGFYGTDNFFMREYWRFGGAAFVLNSRLEHSFSNHSDEKKDVLLWRYRDLVKGFSVLTERRFILVREWYLVLFLVKALIRVVKTHDVQFLREAWKVVRHV